MGALQVEQLESVCVPSVDHFDVAERDRSGLVAGDPHYLADVGVVVGAMPLLR